MQPLYTKQKTCQFYNLEPFLKTYSVEDITTAIQTGWKLLGEENIPTLNFHKDTKLLIAVGQAEKVALIAQVLQQLTQQLANERASNSATGTVVSPAMRPTPMKQNPAPKE